MCDIKFDGSEILCQCFWLMSRNLFNVTTFLTCLTNKAAFSECSDITYSDAATLDVMVSSIQALANVATLF